MEHVACGQHRLSVGAHLHFVTGQIAVTAQYFLFIGVPYDKLPVGMPAYIELIQVERLARTASCRTLGAVCQVTI